MDILKKSNLFLIIFVFFNSVGLINLSYGLFIKDYTNIWYMVGVNLIISLPFFILYKIKFQNINKPLILLLLLWSITRVLLQDGNIIDYSITISYSICLILKQTKIKLLPVIIIIASLFVVMVIIMIQQKGNIARISNNLLLIITMCLIHLKIYYNEYKEKPDFKTLYNLTDQELSIIQELFKPNPADKRIAEDLNMSESSVKGHLGNIYDKLNIAKGGSRRTDLVSTLSNKGFTI